MKNEEESRMTTEMWRDGEMESRLGNPLNELRGIRFMMENFACLIFPAKDIESLKISQPTPSKNRPPRYYYAQGGVRIRLRPSANQMDRFTGGLYDGPDMTVSEDDTSGLMIPRGKGCQYCLPFERLIKGQDIVDVTLFYKRPWLYYDDAWDDDVAKCLEVYVPYDEADRNWKNVLQQTWIDPEGCLNIVVHPLSEDVRNLTVESRPE